ncbi:hypothetical protein Leryth_006523 [Lithospermum erythrorhizon]|nr:hypothetical protein Leryth_006523 [Lithospermum erythrorhizon]
MFAPTMRPIARGAIVLMVPRFGSMAVAYTVYINPNVITISITSAFMSPTPAATANPADGDQRNSKLSFGEDDDEL